MNPTTQRKAALLVALIVTASLGLWAQAATPPPQTFGTTIYFDYSFNATNNGYLTGTDTAKALNNKFAFRRAYFTYENRINDILKFRFRLDADNTANITSIDFAKASTKKDDKLRPFMKHLYLDWAGLLPNSSLKIGMVETQAFKVAEDRWGYRSVAKTILDGYKDITGVDTRTSSADIGVNLTGSINKYLRYGAMVMNGEGYSHPELNKYKKFGGYLQLIPVAGLNVWGYAETERLSDSATAQMYKMDVYFDMIPNLNISGEWFSYGSDNNFNKVALPDGSTVNNHYNVGGFSIFGTYKIIIDKLNVFARFDSYTPDSTNNNKNLSLAIVGFDWVPIHGSWRIQPNIWFYNYQDSAKKNDVVVNLTFFLSF
jgi:hypothetical protein